MSDVAILGENAYVVEWALGKVLKVSLSEGSEDELMGEATPFVAGIKAPVAVLASGDSLLVSDWLTGTIYRITPAV